VMSGLRTGRKSSATTIMDGKKLPTTTIVNT